MALPFPVDKMLPSVWPSIKQKESESVGVESERSRNLKAFAAAMERADLSRPLTVSPAPPPIPSAAAPSVSRLFPLIMVASEIPDMLFVSLLERFEVNELECELAGCPVLTSITPSCVPRTLPMTLCCLGGTAGPLFMP